jgi:hypothetical protein
MLVTFCTVAPNVIVVDVRVVKTNADTSVMDVEKVNCSGVQDVTVTKPSEEEDTSKFPQPARASKTVVVVSEGYAEPASIAVVYFKV